MVVAPPSRRSPGRFASSTRNFSCLKRTADESQPPRHRPTALEFKARPRALSLRAISLSFSAHPPLESTSILSRRRPCIFSELPRASQSLSHSPSPKLVGRSVHLGPPFLVFLLGPFGAPTCVCRQAWYLSSYFSTVCAFSHRLPIYLSVPDIMHKVPGAAHCRRSLCGRRLSLLPQTSPLSLFFRCSGRSHVSWR